MTNKPPALPDNLQLVENQVRLVSFTFGLSLYTSIPLSKYGAAVLACYDKFLELCSKDRLRFYCTETMSTHKPVTNRTFNMLATWFKAGALPKEDIGLELKDGDTYDSTATFVFRISGSEKGSVGYGKDANVVKMAFPADWGLTRTDQMLGLMSELCNLLPFDSGHAGFSFESSRYQKAKSQTYAWRMSMRHRGIDISRIPPDTMAVGQDGIKGVAWLTALGGKFIKELGGAKKIRQTLSREIEVVEVGEGMILKAGPAPATGDKNRGESLPRYREVYRLVAPLVDVAANRSLSFSLGAADNSEMTRAWFHRFGDE
jgi:hypothetical protein